MKAHPLPQTRTEFEDRANLFILMERLKEFLQIKHDFMIAQNNRMSLHSSFYNIAIQLNILSASCLAGQSQSTTSNSTNDYNKKNLHRKYHRVDTSRHLINCIKNSDDTKISQIPEQIFAGSRQPKLYRFQIRSEKMRSINI